MKGIFLDTYNFKNKLLLILRSIRREGNTKHITESKMMFLKITKFFPLGDGWEPKMRFLNFT